MFHSRQKEQTFSFLFIIFQPLRWWQIQTLFWTKILIVDWDTHAPFIDTAIGVRVSNQPDDQDLDPEASSARWLCSTIVILHRLSHTKQTNVVLVIMTTEEHLCVCVCSCWTRNKHRHHAERKNVSSTEADPGRSHYGPNKRITHEEKPLETHIFIC